MLKLIHIKNEDKVIASNKIEYLKKFFTIEHLSDNELTKLTPRVDIIFGTINKFGNYEQKSGELLIAGLYSEVLPITIVMPEGRVIINKNNTKLEDIEKQISELQQKKEEIKTYYREFWPITFLEDK